MKQGTDLICEGEAKQSHDLLGKGKEWRDSAKELNRIAIKSKGAAMSREATAERGRVPQGKGKAMKRFAAEWHSTDLH